MLKMYKSYKDSDISPEFFKKKVVILFDVESTI